ncbi:MAG TPA: tripartite tricarboxylate transporter substrate binding protein [Alphaproteobacteria bacterium]
MARVAAALLAVGVTAGGLGVAQAQDYPNRPIRYIVTTAPGGLMDVPARLLSDSLDRMLGQRVLVENRGGAGGNVGMDIMVKSPPDGYTLAQIQVGNVAINPFIYKDLSYDVFTDIVPVAPLTSSPILVVVNAGLAAKDLGQLIALAKAEPGKLNYGSAGVGTAPHLAGELFARAADIKIVHVPYRGAGPAITDLAAGQVQISFVGLGAVRSHIEGGRVRALAVAQPHRLKAAPDVPTTAEAGLPSYEFVTWFGVGAPRGTPRPVIDKLVGAIHAMQDDPTVQKRLGESGMEPLQESPEQFAARIRQDHDRLRDVVLAAGIKPE